MPVHPPGWRSSGYARAKASGPLTRITPIPPMPGGVAIAAIVSFCIVGLYTRGSTSLFMWYISHSQALWWIQHKKEVKDAIKYQMHLLLSLRTLAQTERQAFTLYTANTHGV